ncbi:hypothetical protein RND71_035627 [Anisodus tanguticus]|uniref:Uncharacterized protein n=1 Tax=Anisodus tanguticus TaxID=243964 RepID=A0AAE1R591_9SOLA|nr:hypothetical protein RND71_035627 [Anisodus tanguticus]
MASKTSTDLHSCPPFPTTPITSISLDQSVATLVGMVTSLGSRRHNFLGFILLVVCLYVGMGGSLCWGQLDKQRKDEKERRWQEDQNIRRQLEDIYKLQLELHDIGKEKKRVRSSGGEVVKLPRREIGWDGELGPSRIRVPPRESIPWRNSIPFFRISNRGESIPSLLSIKREGTRAKGWGRTLYHIVKWIARTTKMEIEEYPERHFGNRPDSISFRSI